MKLTATALSQFKKPRSRLLFICLVNNDYSCQTQAAAIIFTGYLAEKMIKPRVVCLQINTMNSSDKFGIGNCASIFGHLIHYLSSFAFGMFPTGIVESMIEVLFLHLNYAVPTTLSGRSLPNTRW